MKIAVTDACIFIDLKNLSVTPQFFKLNIEFHTSLDVINELFEEHKLQLSEFQQNGILTIHSISEGERLKIRETLFPRALSEVDKTVLFLAEKLDANILSSDKAVRNYAKNRSIDSHGMLWILDQLVNHTVISKHEAFVKLNTLIKLNIFYQNNAELIAEINKRLHQWGLAGASYP